MLVYSAGAVTESSYVLQMVSPSSINLSCSENISAFFVHVAEVVDRGRVHHRLSSSHASPDIRRHILTVLDFVFLHFFQVLVLSRAAMTSDRLVVAGMQGVALFERPEEWLPLGGSRLVLKGKVGAKGREVRPECSSLAHSV